MTYASSLPGTFTVTRVGSQLMACRVLSRGVGSWIVQPLDDSTKRLTRSRANCWETFDNPETARLAAQRMGAVDDHYTARLSDLRREVARLETQRGNAIDAWAKLARLEASCAKGAA